MTTIAAKIPDNYFKIDLIDSMEGTPIEATPPGSSRTFQFTALGKDYEYILEKYPEDSIAQKYVNICVNYALTILKEQLPAIPTTLFTLSQRQIKQLKQKLPTELEETAQEILQIQQNYLDSYPKSFLKTSVLSVRRNFSSARAICLFAQNGDFGSTEFFFQNQKEKPSEWVKQKIRFFDILDITVPFESDEKRKEIKNTLEAITKRSYDSQYMKNAEKDIQQLPSSQKRSNYHCNYVAAAVVTLVAGYFAYAYR